MSARTNISSGSPLEAPIGFSRAVRVGPIIAVSGTAPIADDGSTAAPGDVYGQTVRCFRVAEQAIVRAGGTLSGVYRTRIMLTDISRWEDSARAHGEIFGAIHPACTFVEVSGFINKEWLVEIEADCFVEACPARATDGIDPVVAYDYFIASRYRNRERVIALTGALRERGFAVYCFPESEASRAHCGELNEDPEEVMAAWESAASWRESPAVRAVFDSDMDALRASRNVILLLPAGKSAHIEAGVAYGLGKHLIVIGEQEQTELLYLIFNDGYVSEDAFLQALGGAGAATRGH